MANARNPARRRGTKVKLFPKQLVGFNMELDISGAIKKLEADVRQLVLRSATRAAALVMYNEMQLRVNAIRHTGVLYSAIYHYHDNVRSTRFRQVYAVGVNKKTAPHWYNVEFGQWRYNKIFGGVPRRSKSDKSRSNQVNPPGSASFREIHNLPGALMVPVWTPASPYIRPTWEAKVGQLSRAFNQRARERFAEIVNGSAATGEGE